MIDGPRAGRPWWGQGRPSGCASAVARSRGAEPGRCVGYAAGPCRLAMIGEGRIVPEHIALSNDYPSGADAPDRTASAIAPNRGWGHLRQGKRDGRTVNMIDKSRNGTPQTNRIEPIKGSARADIDAFLAQVKGL